MALSKLEAGELLRRKREQKSLTQDQVCEQVGIPTITQLSEYETGKVNVARSKYLPDLARVLGLSQDEVRSINPSAVFEVSAPARTPATAFHIPEGLRQAIELYGKRFSDLLSPVWQRYLAGFQWRNGQPDDPEAWLDLYRDLTRAGIVPGEN